MRERLIGAITLVIIAVILIPWLISRAHRPGDIVIKASWPASASTPSQPYVLPLQSTAPTTSSIASTPPPMTIINPRGGGGAGAGPIVSSASSAPSMARPSSPSVNAKTASSGSRSTRLSVVNAQQTRSGWRIQAASFSDLKSAQTLKNQLEQAGFKVSLAPHRVGETIYYRVRVGPYSSKARAQSAAPGVARISRTRVLVHKVGSDEG